MEFIDIAVLNNVVPGPFNTRLGTHPYWCVHQLPVVLAFVSF